jgi:ABC-type multidrug transport system fused ATPase/permease subunit
MNAITRYWSIIKEFPGRVLLVFGLILIGAIFEALGWATVLPLLQVAILGEELGGFGKLGQLFQWMIDLAGSLDKTLFIIVLTGLLFTAKAVTSIATKSVSSRFVWELRADWAEKLASRMLHGDISEVILKKSGALVSDLTVQTTHAAKFVKFMTDLMVQIVLGATLYALLLTLNPLAVGILTVLIAIAHLLTKRVFGRISFNIGVIRLNADREFTQISQEIASGWKEIKITGSERLFQGALQRLFRTTNPEYVKYDLILSVPEVIQELLLVGTGLAALGVIYFYDNSAIEQYLPVIGTFLVLGKRLTAAASGATNNYMQSLALQSATDVIMNTLHDAREVQKQAETGASIKSINEDIRFVDVRFAYPDRPPVLEQFNLVIPHGKTTAIVGRSGSGKSTLADLILRFWRPQNGGVLCGNVSIQDFQISDWRSRIGYVSQDSYLFGRSIRDNILLGYPGGTDNEIKRAAKLACMDEFIDSLPQGYDTMVGDRGVTLSGGQRQRICIARAIIRNPDLYIFDEATSALDSTSERQVQKAIENVGKIATVIIIAHRISTIAHADQIYEMTDGKISRVTYAELVERHSNRN